MTLTNEEKEALKHMLGAVSSNALKELGLNQSERRVLLALYVRLDPFWPETSEQEGR